MVKSINNNVEYSVYLDGVVQVEQKVIKIGTTDLCLFGKKM